MNRIEQLEELAKAAAALPWRSSIDGDIAVCAMSALRGVSQGFSEMWS